MSRQDPLTRISEEDKSAVFEWNPQRLERLLSSDTSVIAAAAAASGPAQLGRLAAFARQLPRLNPHKLERVRALSSKAAHTAGEASARAEEENHWAMNIVWICVSCNNAFSIWPVQCIAVNLVARSPCVWYGVGYKSTCLHRHLGIHRRYCIAVSYLHTDATSVIWREPWLASLVQRSFGALALLFSSLLTATWLQGLRNGTSIINLPTSNLDIHTF